MRALAKRRRRRKGSDDKAPAVLGVRVAVDLVALEMARGHDGLLRGHPEPSLVVGVYRVGEGPAELVGRGQITLHPSGSYPLVVELQEETGELVRARVELGNEQSLALLGIALERDGGRDLSSVYATMAEVGAIRLWDGTTAVPSPLPIGEMALREGAPVVQVVQLIVSGSDLGETCTDDELVGACLALRPRRRTSEDVRLPFATADGANDWTAVLRISVR